MDRIVSKGWFSFLLRQVRLLGQELNLSLTRKGTDSSSSAGRFFIDAFDLPSSTSRIHIGQGKGRGEDLRPAKRLRSSTRKEKGEGFFRFSK